LRLTHVFDLRPDAVRVRHSFYGSKVIEESGNHSLDLKAHKVPHCSDSQFGYLVCQSRCQLRVRRNYSGTCRKPAQLWSGDSVWKQRNAFMEMVDMDIEPCRPHSQTHLSGRVRRSICGHLPIPLAQEHQSSDAVVKHHRDACTGAAQAHSDLPLHSIKAAHTSPRRLGSQLKVSCLPGG